MTWEAAGIAGGEDAGTRDLVIGVGVRIEGDVKAPGAVRLFGTVEGDLTAGDVLIGQSGSVVGSLRARTADIFGEVAKEAEVSESVTLRATARLNGELRYRSIQIEAGAKLVCSMKLLEDSPKALPHDAKPTPPVPPTSEILSRPLASESGAVQKDG